MVRSARFGGLVLAIALAITACGGGGNKAASSSSSSAGSSGSSSTSSSGGNGSLEACKLSESDVGSVVGFTVKKQDGGSASSCTYSALDTDSNHVGSTVSLNVAPFQGGDAEIVGELVVFTANTQVVVAVGGLDKDTVARKDQTIALAKKLLA
jgi:hypothetical protein